jgi:hypothetical protein
MKVEFTKEWCMNMSKIEARAAELHEHCRMPMEQARDLAASEAGPDWYARGQDWGLADALTAGQDGDWTLDDIARAFAAGAQAGTATEGQRSLELECRCVALEEQADLTATHLSRTQSDLQQSGMRAADYLRKAIKAETEVAQARQAAESWKAEHLAGNTRIGELHDEAERMRDVLHRMLEAPTTQISATWKEAARQALALGPNVR